MKKLCFILLTILMCKTAFAQTLTQREIIPGVFTMGVPGNLEPGKELYGNLTGFNDGYTFMDFYLSDYKGSMGYLGAMLEHKDWKKTLGFQVKGDIDYYSASEISFVGYYGYKPDPINKTKDTYVAYIFFGTPDLTSRGCWFIDFSSPIESAAIKEDIEHFLSTTKIIGK